jgi:hypothetical protein
LAGKEAFFWSAEKSFLLVAGQHACAAQPSRNRVPQLKKNIFFS